MTIKNTLQSGYDRLRQLRPFSALVNFCTARERTYRERCARAAGKAIDSRTERDGSVISTGAGIFKGMRWPRAVVVGSEFAPKVLGTYELEIQHFFRRFFADGDATSFVDIGAAEGYYAVGAALSKPGLKVFAFERQKQAHKVIADLAARNGVSQQIDLHAEFDLVQARDFPLGERPVVLVDIEGGEKDLIDEDFADFFRRAIVVVEIHDFAFPGAGRKVREVLSRTHKLQVVDYSASIRRSLRAGTGFSVLDWDLATSEKRPHGNYWLICEPDKTR